MGCAGFVAQLGGVYREVFGRQPYMSCSPVLGWYLCVFPQIHLVVANGWRHTGGVASSSSCQHLRRVPYPSSLRRSRSLGGGSIRPPLMPKAVFDVYAGGGRLALQGCATEVSTCVEVVVMEFVILNHGWKTVREHTVEVVRLGPGGLSLDGIRRCRLGVRPHLLPRVTCLLVRRHEVLMSPRLRWRGHLRLVGGHPELLPPERAPPSIFAPVVRVPVGGPLFC